MAPALSRGFALAPGLFGGLDEPLDEPGPTPRHWAEADPERTAHIDVALALVAAALGQVHSWTNQQAGRIVHNILPSPEHSHEQVGASSAVPLAWHTEDAFHPERADLVLLACVRNPDRIGTRLAGIRDAALTEADLAQLARPLLTIEPDDSYGGGVPAGAEQIGMSTVWHTAAGRCVRYDPSYTRVMTDDARFVAAFRRLDGAFEECGFTVDLAPGDLLIVDNDAMVHGRVAFRARYDGTDRWVKRALVRLPRPRPAGERREHGYHQNPVYAVS
ncbi:TauD/TfdA family dioxygenase [Phytohabitans rumicis]|uniref:TauD/TfdA family dioxygenase n=1 Tax=Phytohabitans rumicis TaxID=1076125 RepID=UPI001C498F07|nr:TauD/TfdA family dioxygenase [Phytohabitans rumicis]